MFYLSQPRHSSVDLRSKHKFVILLLMYRKNKEISDDELKVRNFPLFGINSKLVTQYITAPNIPTHQPTMTASTVSKGSKRPSPYCQKVSILIKKG